jgi:hypothetical protein
MQLLLHKSKKQDAQGRKAKPRYQILAAADRNLSSSNFRPLHSFFSPEARHQASPISHIACAASQIARKPCPTLLIYQKRLKIMK